MAITYPLSMPALPGIKRITLAARSIVSSSVSPFTGQEQIYEHQGQWWEAGVTLHEMVREDAEPWAAFLLSLNGKQGTFLLGDPGGKIPRGVATGTPLVKGAAQSGQVLLTDGWTIDITGILLAGDYIQLGSGATTRLHKVLKDADSDGIGDATLDIWPRTREIPGDDDPITVQDCKGTFRLAGNATQIEIERSKIYGVAFSAREAY